MPSPHRAGTAAAADADLGAQLRMPSGPDAAAFGRQMHQANVNLIRASIALMRIKDRNRVLETGSGNGAHVDAILTAAAGVHYTGIDWSSVMIAEARRLNAARLAAGSALFIETDAAVTTCVTATFDKALAVNTLYFWPKPEQQLAEIHRVLKPAGVLVLAFGDKAFMRKLPFVNADYRLYNHDEAAQLMADNGFTLLESHALHEIGESNTGEQVKKHFHLLRLAATSESMT